MAFLGKLNLLFLFFFLQNVINVSFFFMFRSFGFGLTRQSWASFETKLSFFFFFFRNVTNVSFFSLSLGPSAIGNTEFLGKFNSEIFFFFVFYFFLRSITNVSFFSFLGPSASIGSATLGKFHFETSFFCFFYETSTNVSFNLFLGTSAIWHSRILGQVSERNFVTFFLKRN